MQPEPQSVQAFFHARGPEDGDDHFVLTAVLVEPQHFADVRAAVDRVRAKYAIKSDLRAAHLAKKPTHFVRALEDLAQERFTFYAIVVDQTRLPLEHGVAAEEGFHARLAGMLYRQLFALHPSLQVTAAESGRAAFMGSFSEFLLRHHERSLFDQPRFRFVAAQDEPLVQLADVISGALARTYESPDTDAKSAQLLELIRPRHALQIDEWPVRYQPRSGTSSQRSDASDDDVARHAIAAAERFIESHSTALDEDVRGQVLVLTRLLFEARFSESRSYLATEILRHALAPVGKANESLHWLRSNVIAPLRDAGVLVASSARGYKIPLSVADVTDFVLRTDTVVHPMLHRVARAREAVKHVTKGRVDVLADDRFALLRAAVDAAKTTD